MTENLAPELKNDVALIYNSTDKTWDVEIADDGDLLACAGYDSALLNDGLTELRADANEQPIAKRRSGWIGNETPETEGYKVGSKLYFYYSARATVKEKNGSADALRDSFAKYVPKYLKDVVVTGELANIGIRLNVELIRYSGPVEKLHFNLWELTGK